MVRYHVSLEFCNVLIPSIPCQSLKITRSYDILLNKENVEILIDGVPNKLTDTIRHEIFINDFILKRYCVFFFDSEKLFRLPKPIIEEKRKLCSAYNEVLGIKNMRI